MATKKLIEVALPLEKINDASAREKSIRHGHPSTLHLWWARRPLAAARAVIWSSLVDDPSSHPELFPTEEDQNKERQRLFKVLEDLVIWENSNNTDILGRAKEEISRYSHGNIPALLDPFAGGGAIPLEAQRLGLEAHAHDLNPVAVTINKSMIEIPVKFSGMPPINPRSTVQKFGEVWSRSEGLASDVEYYGNLLRDKCFNKVGSYYPKVNVPKEMGGGDATVIAWLWARTCTCTNPACKKEMPLIRNFNISKKKGKEAHVECDTSTGSLKFIVKKGLSKVDGTISRTGAKCVFCGYSVDLADIRIQGKSGGIGDRLIAVVAEGQKGRLFITPDDEQQSAASSVKRPEIELGDLAHYPGYINPPAYGFTTIESIFTDRQLNTLVEMCNALNEIKSNIHEDASFVSDNPLYRNFNLADYENAIVVYMAFLIDQVLQHSSSICSWNAPNTQMRSTFGMTGMSMAWDYAECNLFSHSTGSFNNLLERMVKGFELLGTGKEGVAKQFDAQTDTGMRNILVSTDPPYYNNVPYADFSDFFYVWLRKNIQGIYPELFRTMLVPKKEELVADPYREDRGIAGAKKFFEDGMYETFSQVYEYSGDEYPVTIYYAFKQSDTEKTDEKGTQASTGWEIMLSAIIRAGFSITGTWPIRTEKQGRVVGNGQNALASSIVLVCRKRPSDASVCTRRNFINELKRELKPALKNLQSSNIAPVDLAQSAIGPGIGVYSKYSQVLEADGTPMTVRSALQIINQELDLYFNEQDSDLDTESRFCVDLYSQSAFNEIPFGDANTLATAKNTSVAIMASHGTLYAQKGKVHLIERPELPTRIDSNESSIWLLCQQLTYKMEKEGIEGCAAAIANMYGSNAERAKDLAYRLYTIAERKKWAQEAYAYNALVVAWPEIQSRAAELKAIVPQQLTLEDFINNNN